MLAPDDDVFTNHIHADDLARAAVAALFRGKPNRAYNVTDDAELKMGGWFDAVADAFQLAASAARVVGGGRARIAPMLLSFMSESRRLANARMKRELRVRLRYPTPQAMLAEVAPRELEEAARAAAGRANDGRRARRRRAASTRWQRDRRAARRLRAADPARQADRHAAAAVADARRAVARGVRQRHVASSSVSSRWARS